MQTLPELISLKGKLSIITGPTAGIGKAIATRFAEAGSDLILISRTLEDLEATKGELSEFGVDIQLFPVDLSKREDIVEFYDKIEDQTPNILVNNAGIFPMRNFHEMEYEEYLKVMDININAVYSMCYFFTKKLLDKKEPGNIVNISSLEAVVPVREGLAHYGVSKAGVLALTRELARDFGENGIRANAILPGGVMTRGAKEGAKDFLKNPFGMIKGMYDFNSRLPLKRIGEPDDIAKMVLVMASDLSAYMTGAVIPVDGGFLSS